METAFRQPPNSFHPREVGLVLQLREKNQALIRHMDADGAKLTGELGKPSILYLSPCKSCSPLCYSRAELCLGVKPLAHLVIRRGSSTLTLKHHRLTKKRAFQTFCLRISSANPLHFPDLLFNIYQIYHFPHLLPLCSSHDQHILTFAIALSPSPPPSRLHCLDSLSIATSPSILPGPGTSPEILLSPLSHLIDSGTVSKSLGNCHCIQLQEMRGENWRRARAHLTLEPIGFLGPASLHIFRQRGVFMQFFPVLQVTGQSLGLLSMPDVDHVHGQVKVGLTLFEAFLVFNLECTKTRCIT